MIASDNRRIRRRSATIALAFAVTFAAFHFPFLPQSLEDLDSINFALGLRQFDVARHQPHPPGYPLFILLGRAANTIVRNEAAALSAVGMVAGSVGALAILALYRRLFRPHGIWPLAAAAIAATSPLYWLTAARPLSDMAGLSASIGVQAAVLAAQTTNALFVAAFAAGLATGIRSQVFWLTAPLLVWRVARDRTLVSDASRRVVAAVVFSAGVLLWLVPLVAISGGPGAYWRALSNQGSEDLGGIRMLWTTPTVREFVDALYFAFVAPWAVWPAAVAVLTASAAGVVVAWRAERSRLGVLAIAFVPYLVFDILFQETFTIRYALPLVVPVALLAARGLQAVPVPMAFVALGGLVMWDAHVGGRSVAALAREPAPVFRLLTEMKAASTGSAAPVLAPDRRQSFDLRRPLLWLSTEAPVFDRELPAPPQHEWLEAVKYWNDGGRAPLWFVVDPRRAFMGLIHHGAASRFEWSAPYPILMSGTRPNDADWYRVDRPDWYVGEGWALTPESAGVAGRDRRGMQSGAIDAWIHRSTLAGGSLLVGGRNFEVAVQSTVTIDIGAVWSKRLNVPPGPFLSLARFPPAQFDAPTPEYVKLTLSAQPPGRIAVEQFDVAPQARAVLGYGQGWYEHELDPASGRHWRWLSDRGELVYAAPAGWTLHVEGESPLRYYSRPSRIIVRSGDHVIRELTVGSDFNFDLDLPPAVEVSRLVIETDQTYVPADTSWRRSGDRRRLGLRIFSCELRSASAPGRAANSPPAH